MAEVFEEISADRLRAYMAQHEENEYLLVDVRQPDEYNRGHIPGSVLIPVGEILERMDELPVDRDIVLYCRTGKRSKSAALLIGSRPYVAGTVFNLTGGISAWDGVVLPEPPNLKVFDLSGEPRDLLLRAMELERGAELFYTALRQRYSEIEWAGSLAALAGVEAAHARILYQFWAEGQVDPPAFEALYGGLSGNLVEGGYAAAALVVLLEEEPLAPCRATLEMALAIENSAYDLYRTLAHRFRDQELDPVFNTIAEAEKEHIELAAKALAFCT